MSTRKPRKRRPALDPKRVTENQGPRAIPDPMVPLFVSSGYEINQWSSQPFDAKDHRPEHLVLEFPMAIGGMASKTIVRLKSRRAAMEMIAILEKNADEIWNEDGTLVGPLDADGKPKTAGEAMHMPDENGVQIVKPHQVELQGFSDRLRVQFELEDRTVALELPDQGSALGLCERLFQYSMVLWGEPPEDDDKKSEVMN